MAKGDETMIQGWGRLGVPGQEVYSEDLEQLTEGMPLSRGLGRSYGDSSLPPPSKAIVANTTLANRLLSFNPATGDLVAEAGLSLLELNRIMLPKGFFPPVSPGTQYVTLGGMVASDVHGKDHHSSGTFGRHVQWLKLRVASGEIVTCSREVHPDLFLATLGGMGLTGHILEIGVKLRAISSPWIYQETERIPDLDTMIAGLKEAAKKWPMTAGWIDNIARGKSMGRGILFKGRWADAAEAPKAHPKAPFQLNFPMELPNWILNTLTMGIFNMGVYWSHWRRVARGMVDPFKFWYPLDRFTNWNRAYGSMGLTQHQCVLPDSADNGAVRRFLDVLTSHGGMSFLVVIKDCGPEGEGMLSFPRPGISIAMDMPVRPGTQALIDALNEVVVKEGGRIYLTKDAMTKPEHFQAMEPRLEAFQAVRRAWDPAGVIKSAQSIRLLGDTP